MIGVLALICTVCGAALSGFRDATAERIEYQVLTNVQGPRVAKVLEGSDNDLIGDRKKIVVDGQEILLFVGRKAGGPWAIAYETVGEGFGGELTVMAGYDLARDRLTGIRIISHKETPGIGAEVTEDQFTGRFEGLGLDVEFRIESEGGDIDALSGATYSSHGVCEAIRKSVLLYPRIKAQISNP